MIKGVKYWQDRERYYTQTNNPTEEMLRKRADGNWLVSCGPSAAVSCIAAMGYDVSVKCPGMYQPQTEEVLMDYFNDPRNYDALKKVRPEIDPRNYYGNEIAQFYEVAVPAVFGVKCSFAFGGDFDKVASLLQSGKAVQLCLVKPGHYIAGVAFDDTARELIYNDPWPGRFKDGNGFNRRMGEVEFRGNVKPYRIVYGG
jgi:hypothetical protein